MAANTEQLEYWNADAGKHWVRERDRYDRMVGAFGLRAIDAAGLTPGSRVLDVGCGCGATTVESARRISPGGEALGVDLSLPMLDVARERATEAGVPARFEQGDAQSHPFEADAFDAAISRFGVMFFADPPAAFANIRRALRPDGRLSFVCWREAMHSEWIALLAAAAVPHLGMPPMPGAGEPGPFAFGDEARVREILDAAGFSAVSVEEVRLPTYMGTDAEDVVAFLRDSTMFARMTEGAPEDKVAAAVADARAALVEREGPEGVVLTGSAWLVTARA